MKVFVSISALLFSMLAHHVYSDDYLSEWGIMLSDPMAQNVTDAGLETCAENVTNHGQFVSCVAHLMKELVTAGDLNQTEAQEIQTAAAQSDVGKGDGEGGDGGDGGDGNSTYAPNSTMIPMTMPPVSLPSASEFLTEQGIVLSSKSAAAFDDCQASATSWGEFNSCAQHVANSIKKASKKETKNIKQAISAYKSTFLQILAEGEDNGDGSSNSTMAPTNENSTIAPSTAATTMVPLAPLGQYMEDQTGISLPAQTVKQLNSCSENAKNWGKINSCAHKVLNSMKKSLKGSAKKDEKSLSMALKSYKKQLGH